MMSTNCGSDRTDNVTALRLRHVLIKVRFGCDVDILNNYGYQREHRELFVF